MNAIVALTQKIKRKKTQLYMIQKASQGHPLYLKAYPDRENRARKAIKLTQEVRDLSAERDKVDKEFGIIRRKGANGRPRGYKKRLTFVDSFGNTWTQKEIDAKRSEAYRIAYADKGPQKCKGCNEARAQGSAHSIPQAFAKKHRITETIWDLENFWPACHECNRKAENPKGDWETLKNAQQMINYIQKHSELLYNKFINHI